MSVVSKLLYVTFMLTAALAGLEVLFRVFGYHHPQPGQTSSSVEAYFWVADPTLGFSNRPDARYTYWGIAGSPVTHTDHEGYRRTYSCASDPGISPRPAGVIVFVGDSTTMQTEVNDEETSASQVAKMLCSQGINIRVVNAGVRGFNTLQAGRMMEKVINDNPDVRAVVYTYCDNDLFENLDPFLYAPAIAPVLSWDRDNQTTRVREVGMELVPWGQSFESLTRPSHSVSIVRKAIVATHSTALYNISVIFFGWLSTHRAKTARAGTGAGQPPGVDSSDGVALEKWAAGNHGPEILEKQLAAMRVVSERRGVRFLATRFTTGGPGESDKESMIAQRARNAGVVFVPIASAFGLDSARYRARSAYTRSFDRHYNQIGAYTLAVQVLASLKSAVH